MEKKALFLICALACMVCYAEDIKLIIPETIYAVPGVEMNVYHQNIVTVINPANYVFEVTCPKGYNFLKRWSFTPKAEDVGSWPWKIRVLNQNGVVAEAESKLVVIPADAGKNTKITMLMVGASQTAAGLYARRVTELMALPGNPKFNTIGTRGKKDVKVEGYGGWVWKTFFTRWGITQKNTQDGMHPRRSVQYNSPFLFPDPEDPSKPVFDLTRYLKEKNNGKVPEVVSFQLGLNDFIIAKEDNLKQITEDSLSCMEKMISEFRKLKPQPAILILQHIPGANQDAFGRNFECSQTAWQYRQNLVYYNRALLKKAKAMGLFVVPMYINIDTENNFPMLEQPVNSGNPKKIFRNSNGVHPVKAGYYQMGDTVYSWLKAYLWLQQKKSK